MVTVQIDRAKLRATVARYYEEPIARALIWARIGPNAVTLLGLALSGRCRAIGVIRSEIAAGSRVPTWGKLISRGARPRFTMDVCTGGSFMVLSGWRARG